MRRIGIVCAILGAVLVVGLVVVQRTAWFADEATYRLSEPVEWIRSGFWASIVLTALGLLLFGCSFRKPREPAAEPLPETELPADDAAQWETPLCCAYCGQPLSPNAAFCRACGMERFPAAQSAASVPEADAEPWDATSPRRAPAGERPPDAASGVRQSVRETNWRCPWCGRVHDDSASVCTACGFERFS